MLVTTNEKSTQHTPTILKYPKEKHQRMSKVNKITGNYFQYGGLSSEPLLSNYLFTRNTVLIIFTNGTITKNKLYYQKANTFIVHLKYIGLGKTTYWLA